MFFVSLILLSFFLQYYSSTAVISIKKNLNTEQRCNFTHNNEFNLEYKQN